MTILGGRPSPILDIRLRAAGSEGLVVWLVVWLPFSGNGLTGLTTPDMVVFGVGGRGLRDVLCGDAATTDPSGFGDGLPKRASRVFFCSEGSGSFRSEFVCTALGAGDRAGGKRDWLALNCGDGLLNISSKLIE